MRIRVSHDIGDLANDLAGIAVNANRKVAQTVRRNAHQGNRIAKDFAKETSGAHGVHYPDAFSAEMIAPLSWEYGPDASKKQGGMAFEFGPGRQTRPHLSLNRSADIVGPKFGDDVSHDLDELFW